MLVRGSGRRDRRSRARALGARAEQILNFAGEGVYTTDAAGRCTFVNEAAARMLGTDVHLLLGANVHDTHHVPTGVAGVAGAACRVCTPVASGGLSRGEDQQFTRGDGAQFTVEYTTTSMYENGELVRIVTFNDITERKRAEAALRESELKFRAVAQTANDAIVSADANGDIIAWNRGAQLVFGYEEAEVLAKPLTMLMPPEFREAHNRGMGRFLASRQAKVIGTTVEVAGLRKDGTTFPVELSLAHWEQGPDTYFTGILRDISERKQAEVALAREVSYVQLLESVAVAANEASDSSEALQFAVSRISAHTGWPVGHVYLVDDQEKVPLVPSEIWHVAEGTPFEEFRRVTQRTPLPRGVGLPGRVLATGQPAWISDVTEDANFPRARTAQALGMRAGFAFPVLVGREVAAVLEFFTAEALEPNESMSEVMGQIGTQLGRVIERERAEARLTHHALHDHLTGLPNRVLFLDRLALALERTKRHAGVAVLFLDLDRFKLVNDSLGHEAGDHLLVAVASRLKSVIRSGDTVARFGGDEFVVVCENLASEEDAAGAAERLREALSAPFLADGNEVFITVSIGIAVADGADATPSALLRDADSALYRAKDEGRARHELFTEAMRARAVQRLDTVNALHRAVERNELRVEYQPQIALGSEAIVGMEALVRWQHPERGFVQPTDFIPLAEETGIITSIGRWVLREACRQGRLWNDVHPSASGLAMSVNLSVKQLQQSSLVEEVAEILASTGFNPANLVLEITESVLMFDTAATLDRLEQLKALGVRLAIDDFGTGYSSLTYLRQFPIDVLKIDKSSIDGLGGDHDQSAVAKTIVRLAQTLRLETVAEGVERIEHVRELQTLACDRAQGFYFARPLDARHLDQLLRQQFGDAPGAPTDLLALGS
ncbi:MAG: EAL domain-containing protein [Acidimicrobiia bacterium]|nr:EAL domain-containing protein [Acidimicrobiia bacterium]